MSACSVVLPESGFTAFWTVQLCKLSEYVYTDILCHLISKGSQDNDSSCYRTLHRSQDTDICVLMDTRWITVQITGEMAGYSGQTLLSVTVGRSDWFHYCIIVCTVESIPDFDFNHYFKLINLLS